MAGSFTSPSGAPPKMHVGKVNRPKATKDHGPTANKPEYPITDSFASKTIPSFAERRAATNGKTGWNTTPARPPVGRLAQKKDAPERGRGRLV